MSMVTSSTKVLINNLVKLISKYSYPYTLVYPNFVLKILYGTRVRIKLV